MLCRVTAYAAFVFLLLICSAAADEVAIPQPATAITTKSAPQPFGLDAKPIVGGTIVARWSGVEAEIRAETEVLSQCRQGAWCPQAALRFLSIVDEGRSLTGRARRRHQPRRQFGDRANLRLVAMGCRRPSERRSRRLRPVAAIARITPSLNMSRLEQPASLKRT